MLCAVGQRGLDHPSGILFEAQKYLTLDYASAMYGTATITLRATDPQGAWAETTFTITVTPAATLGDFVWNDIDCDGVQILASRAFVR